MVNNFFTDEEVKEIEVQGQVFKYKPTTSGDELDWANDYYDDVEETRDGVKVVSKKQNLGKLSLCKLRNIVSVPFSNEELKEITKIEKSYSEYNNADKDALFRKLQPRIYEELMKKIDASKNSKKKE